MNEIILEITRYAKENYEKTMVYNEGKVVIETKNNGNITTEEKSITIAQDLANILRDNMNKLREAYKDDNERYKISFQNIDIYNFDLYIELNSMIRSDRIKPLNLEVIKEDKNDDEEKINYLNKLNEEKEDIDIEDEDKDIKLDNIRDIISFELKEQSTFEVGETRFFSDTIDIGDNVKLPKYLELVGQVNLGEVSSYDPYEYLPKKGMLYFFQSPTFVGDNFYHFGYVIYSEDENLHRENYPNNETVLNLGIDDIKKDKEDFDTRYVLSEGIKEYSSFKNEELNKIYGFYTDCQMDEEEIKQVSSKYIILLQLGSTIYGEGVTTFLIKKEDLIKRDFSHIIYNYVQS